MKYRKRQYFQCFWWRSRMIMSTVTSSSTNSDHYSQRVITCACYTSLCSLSLFSLLFFLTLVEATDLVTLSPRVVFTKQGPVQGFLGPGNVGAHYQQQTDGSYAFRHYTGRPVVEIFRGIPYASAPVGNLRYESPTPPALRSRTQIYNANVTKPACPVSYSQIMNRTSVPGDPIRALRKTLDLEPDDCLYLDIYLPLNSNKNRGTGLPVLVYANSQMDDDTSSEGDNGSFDGSSMAAIGNIMVITFRFRIGVLGFVRPGFTDDIRSNFGLWDQTAALQWIKENVEEFGGDPNNICLMGYDLDATLAGLISLSPVSQAYNGLFHRLILLNGSPFSPRSINHQPQKTTYHLARNLRCPLAERSEDLANCFRHAPTPQLFGSAESIGAPLLTYPFAPVADGTLIPIDVSREDQRYSQAVLDMLGKYDLLGGLKEGPVLPRTGTPILSYIDLESFVTAAIKLTTKLETDAEPTERLKKEVMNAITNVYGSNPPMDELVSDFLVVYPMHDLLRVHASTGRNTFFYVFKDFDPLRLNKFDEISYIFSNKVYNWKFHSAIPDYRHLVNDAPTGELKPGYGSNNPRPDLYPFVLLISLLANFVRSGDPNVADPNDHSPNTGKPWPKFEANLGRYLELGKEVDFPSGYRKASINFWGSLLPDILKTFANQSSVTDPYGVDRFPSHFTPKKDDDLDSHHDRGRDQIRFPGGFYPTSGGGGQGDDATDSKSILSGIGQNTVVLIGALLLLLNFLCFIGLFYQRERLKKTEIQLRRRFLDTRQAGNADASQEMETASSFERAIPIHTGNHIVHGHGHHGGTPARDAMSETETENGFGPDFLGPNYDPRTKVNRWMNMQNANRHMLSAEHSFENPSPSITSDFHIMNRRETDMPGDPSLSVLPLPPPLQPSNAPLHHQLQNHPPLHIQVTSLQRHSHMPKMMPIYDHLPSHPHQIQILPPLPYQEPFQPSASLVSDIPYADSRNTSPLTLTGYPNSPLATRSQASSKMMAPPNNYNHMNSSPVPFGLPSTTHSTNPAENHRPPSASGGTTPIPPPQKSPRIYEAHEPSSGLTPMDGDKSPSKRTSVVIVRDLDPTENEEPKYVPVKTGTLKRSVGVDTSGHDGSPVKKDGAGENHGGTGHKKDRSSSQIRVTFSEKV